jgi:hypothetical protein
VSKGRIVFGFAAAGFVIGMSLCGYVFYLTLPTIKSATNSYSSSYVHLRLEPWLSIMLEFLAESSGGYSFQR